MRLQLLKRQPRQLGERQEESQRMLWRTRNKEFFLIALRALSQIAKGTQPSRREVIILRRHAPAGDGDLPLDELCGRLIRRELRRDERNVEPAMTEDEMHQFKELAGRALYLGRLRDRRRITEAEYIGLLNVLREQHGLWPLRPDDAGKAPNR